MTGRWRRSRPVVRSAGVPRRRVLAEARTRIRRIQDARGSTRLPPRRGARRGRGLCRWARRNAGGVRGDTDVLADARGDERRRVGDRGDTDILADARGDDRRRVGDRHYPRDDHHPDVDCRPDGHSAARRADDHPDARDHARADADRRPRGGQPAGRAGRVRCGSPTSRRAWGVTDDGSWGWTKRSDSAAASNSTVTGVSTAALGRHVGYWPAFATGVRSVSRHRNPTAVPVSEPESRWWETDGG